MCIQIYLYRSILCFDTTHKAPKAYSLYRVYIYNFLIEYYYIVRYSDRSTIYCNILVYLLLILNLFVYGIEKDVYTPMPLAYHSHIHLYMRKPKGVWIIYIYEPIPYTFVYEKGYSFISYTA